MDDEAPLPDLEVGSLLLDMRLVHAIVLMANCGRLGKI